MHVYRRLGEVFDVRTRAEATSGITFNANVELSVQFLIFSKPSNIRCVLMANTNL